jgi:hypothetical protein
MQKFEKIYEKIEMDDTAQSCRCPLSHGNRGEALAVNLNILFCGLKKKKEADKQEADSDQTSTRSSLGPARYLLSLRFPVNQRWGFSTV